jgi:hypothetical protein
VSSNPRLFHPMFLLEALQRQQFLVHNKPTGKVEVSKLKMEPVKEMSKTVEAVEVSFSVFF